MTSKRSSRDLIDSITDALLAELPEVGVDATEMKLARRATRLGAMLEDALSAHLVSWGLTKAEYGVLTALLSAGAPYELRPTDLRNRLLLTSGGISNVLNRLDKAGLIGRGRADDDGRSSWVRLTRKGLKTTNAAVGSWAEAEADLFRAVPATVRRAAADALRQVLLALGDHEPGTPRVKEVVSGTRRPASTVRRRTVSAR